jgi:membrane protein YdbS with pleckstrin-like domain
MMPSRTSGTSKGSSASDGPSTGIRGSAENVSYRQRAMNRVRIVITMFVLALLTIVILGWVWTTGHQPPPARTASHAVLAVAACAGVFALVKIWRPDPSRRGSER